MTCRGQKNATMSKQLHKCSKLVNGTFISYMLMECKTSPNDLNDLKILNS